MWKRTLTPVSGLRTAGSNDARTVPRMPGGGPMIRDCGGCNDLGAHTRWCPEVHGRLAARYGSQASKAEALADEVGADKPRFLKWLRVADFPAIPKASHDAALKALAKKRKAPK